LPNAPERLVMPVPDTAYHLQPTVQHYSPEKRWVGIHWPDGNFTVQLLEEDQVDPWLNGQDIDRA
jgi:hypothetical protein